MNTVASGVNLFRSYWTWGRASLRLVSDCIGSVLFCWLLKANILMAISVPNVDPAKTAQMATAFNWWTAKMFPFAVAVGVLIALADVYRIIRVRARASQGIVLNTACGSH
jgi:hypothetical protein